MASLKEIKSRIASIKSTQKITAAMKWFHPQSCIILK